MTFVPRPGFEGELLRSTGVKNALANLAKQGADRFRATVPVDTGELRDSIFSDVALTADGYKGRIGATSPHAALVEFGTANEPPDGSLRRAVEGLGTFEPAPGRE